MHQPALLPRARSHPPALRHRQARFDGLAIRYDGHVLAPRAWTSLQSRWARELLVLLPPGPVLELCCGAGQIGLAAVAPGRRRLVQVDASPRACSWAHHNAVAAGAQERVEVRCGDVAEVVAPHERFPLVLADPPYLPSDEIHRFPDDPPTAIDGGDTGLGVPCHVLGVAARHLADGGVVLLQLHGAAQARAMDGEIHRLGLTVAGVREAGPQRAVALLHRRR